MAFQLPSPINQPGSVASGFQGRAMESPVQSTVLILPKSPIILSARNLIPTRVHACFNIRDPTLWGLKKRADVFEYMIP